MQQLQGNNRIVQTKKEVVSIFTSLEPKQKRNIPIPCLLFPARQKRGDHYVLGESYTCSIHNNTCTIIYLTADTNVILKLLLPILLRVPLA